MLVRTLALAALLLATLAVPPAGATGCSAASTAYEPIPGVKGYLARPASCAPGTLVVLSHGYSTTAAAMRPTLDHLAQELDVLAVAMDFRGSRYDFKVSDGAEDNWAAVADLLAASPSLDRVILWGVSMGGLVSATMAMDAPALPQVDELYLVDDVGPTNLPELWATIGAGILVDCDARSLWGSPYRWEDAEDAQAGVAGLPARADASWCTMGLQIQSAMAKEYGGTPADVPQAYVDASPALNQAAWAGAPLTHAYLTYGAFDTYVPPDHGQQLAATLQQAGIPVSLFTAAYRNGEASYPSPWHVTQEPTDAHGTLAQFDDARDDVRFPLAPHPADHVAYGYDIVRRIVAGTATAGPGYQQGLYFPAPDPTEAYACEGDVFGTVAALPCQTRPSVIERDPAYLGAWP